MGIFISMVSAFGLHPLGAPIGAPVSAVQIPLHKKHITDLTPWVREGNFLKYHNGFLNMEVHEMHPHIFVNSFLHYTYAEKANN